MKSWHDHLALALANSALLRWPMVRLITRLDRWLLDRSNGRVCTAVGSTLGRQTLLLHCQGARTGMLRKIPLLGTWDGPDLILIASRAGTDQHPHWYYNLTTSPQCQVSIAGAHRHYCAEQVTGTERTRLWQLAVSCNPGYARYAARTTRPLPVLRLRPTAARSSNNYD